MLAALPGVEDLLRERAGRRGALAGLLGDPLQRDPHVGGPLGRRGVHVARERIEPRQELSCRRRQGTRSTRRRSS